MFWQIYCPVFAALVSAFTIWELFQISVSIYLHKKHEKIRAEFEAKIASGEIDPMSMMVGEGIPGGMGGPMMGLPPLPTASGQQDTDHGQYL